MNDATLVTAPGRDPQRQHGVVNPPVYHASTILFPIGGGNGSRHAPVRAPTTGATARRPQRRWRRRWPRWKAAIASIVVGSGKTAITSMLLALLSSGDHLLVADTVYAPDPQLLHRHPEPLRHRDHLLRPGDRRRHRRADPPRDPAGLHRKPGLAHLRDAGHAGHRRGRARPGLPGRHGQYLGFAPVLQAVPARRRHLGPGGDQIYRRPLRPDDGRRHLHRGRLRPAAGTACSRSPPPRHPTTATSPCVACARWRPGSSGTSAAP